MLYKLTVDEDEEFKIVNLKNQKEDTKRNLQRHYKFCIQMADRFLQQNEKTSMTWSNTFHPYIINSILILMSKHVKFVQPKQTLISLMTNPMDSPKSIKQSDTAKSILIIRANIWCAFIV